MEVRKGYKQTEIGIIPEDWDVISLGEIFEFKNGLNKSKEYFGQGTPIVNYMDVYKNRGLFAKDLKGRVTLSRQEIKNYEVEKGDVFFTRTSETVEEVGISSIILDDVVDTVFSGFVLRARHKNERLDNGFEKYCYSTHQVRKEITAKSSYTTRALTNGSHLSKVKIAIPTTKVEQQAIAAALSDVDSLLTSLDALIAKKRLIKQGAMQELLTGKKRLPRFSGEWKTKAFSEIATTRKQRVDPKIFDEPLFCIELEHIEQGTGMLIGSTDTSTTTSIKTIFRKGDVLFGKLRAYLRKYWLAEKDGVCTTEIWALTPIPEYMVSEFLFYVVQTDKFIQSASVAYGTHMPRTDWNVIKNFEVPTPSSSEQTAIAEILSDMDAEITALESRREKTRLLKQGMMQELLTGRIRLV